MWKTKNKFVQLFQRFVFFRLGDLPFCEGLRAGGQRVHKLWVTLVTFGHLLLFEYRGRVGVTRFRPILSLGKEGDAASGNVSTRIHFVRSTRARCMPLCHA